jgi:hypothetical protein
MKIRRAIELFAGAASLTGGLLDFVTQGRIFEKGNFSEITGAVFIPFLGEHGIYTSRALGTAWYTGLLLFLGGIVGLALSSALRRRHGA